MTAQVGDNNPPEKTPFEISQEEILDLEEQAGHFLDGDPIESGEQAESVQTLMRLSQAAEKTRETNRKAEAAVFDDGKKEVQARYNPLKKKLEDVIATCKQALRPYLTEQARLSAEIKKREQEEAAEKQRIADEAVRKAREGTDLKARKEADRIAEEAKKATKRAEKQTTTKVSAMGRAASIRTYYDPEIVDRKTAAGWFYINRPQEFDAMILGMAKKENHSTKITGINFKERKDVV